MGDNGDCSQAERRMASRGSCDSVPVVALGAAARGAFGPSAACQSRLAGGRGVHSRPMDGPKGLGMNIRLDHKRSAGR